MAKLVVNFMNKLHVFLRMISPVTEWTESDVGDWLQLNNHEKYVHLLCNVHGVDGKALLLLTEPDFKNPPLNIQASTISVRRR